MTIRTVNRNPLILPRARVIHSTHSSCSDASGSSAIARLAEEIKLQQPRRSRRVRFCEDNNEYFANTQITKDECSATWYSSADMKKFKTETAQIARMLLQSTKDSHLDWKDSLLTAYAGMTRAKTVEDMQGLLDTSNLPWIDPTLWGLEKWVLRPVVHDKAARRKQLMAVMNACNEDMSSTQSYKSKMLRKASRDLSRPSRMFALHVALAGMYGKQ